MMAGTGLVLDDCFMRHDTGAGHPERPARLQAISRALADGGLQERCTRIAPVPVDITAVHGSHRAAYVERLQAACRSGMPTIDCEDSTICAASFEIARLAAGSVLRAVDGVARGEMSNAFCAVRPPGHHAEVDRSMGFCLLNNIALAARHLKQHHGVTRVFILDWDVHHGNGTQHAFESDPDVFFCSLHGHPRTLYPGTGYDHERGVAAGEGATLNLPMWPGAGDDEYRAAFRDYVVPAVRAHRPEFMLISAGFDAHRGDPLAQIELDTSSFEWMTHAALELAADLCGGKLVSMLEGGYDLQALAESAMVHLQALLDA